MENELIEFRNSSEAYVIIAPDNVDEVMRAIAPAEYNNKSNFQTCELKVCSSCTDVKKSCFGKNVAVYLPINKRAIRGKTWSYANDTAGKKYEINDYADRLFNPRKIEPKTGGIAYSSI